MIYLNLAAGLSAAEHRFVIAHELLHVGLRHDTRCQGRDPYLWNVACDYVINDWLMEMNVGDFPIVGGLLDPDLKGLSAESIYDRIVTDMRRFRKLATLRGTGIGDILGPEGDLWNKDSGIDLDEFLNEYISNHSPGLCLAPQHMPITFPNMMMPSNGPV